MKSESFKLSKPMVTLLERYGITTATPIQEQIIPAIVAGRDILAQSETGSGKTISFAVPIIEKINKTDGLTALILVPTRELCVQITGEFSKFSFGKYLGVTAVYGGVSIENQIRRLRNTNIVVATPGRLLDLLERRALRLDRISFLVFDEADRMLDMGFIKDIERILKLMSHKRQTMLFSATITKEIVRLSHKYLNDPLNVKLDSSVNPAFLHQTYYQTTPEAKLPLLVYLLKHERDLALVFCNRKHTTTKLAKKLSEQGVKAECLNGDMSQGQRERVTAAFRHKKINVLIATDVASRGLHIEDISHVYNYEIPKDVDSYTHRVGRTARAGKKGAAISLVTGGEEQKFFKQILFTYRGIITLKTVDTADLPKSVQHISDDTRHRTSSRKNNEQHQRKNEQHRRKNEQHRRKNEQPNRGNENPDRKTEHRNKQYENSDRKNEQANGRKGKSKAWRDEWKKLI
jgi:ATP-dependent RNA helicase DeaD